MVPEVYESVNQMNKQIQKTGIVRIALGICAALPLSLSAGAQSPAARPPQTLNPVQRLTPMPRIDPAKVGLDQKRGDQLPLDLTFTDETGRQVKLGDFFQGKPVILNMIFYKCPGVCMAELDGMTKLFRSPDMTMKAGKEFQVVTVSINPKETPNLAADKKREYLELLGKDSDPNGWHFLLGADENIHKLASAVGFRYVYDEKTDQFAHPAGIMVATPEGKLSHYFYGISYSPRDVRFSLIEASQNKIGSLADRIALNCMYQYDPKTGRYGLAIIRALQVGGILTLVTLATSIFVMTRAFNRKADLAEQRLADKSL